MYHRRRIRPAVWLGMALALVCAPALGQPADITQLRSRDPLTPQEQDQVRQWLEAKARQLATASNPARAQQYRQALLEPVQGEPPATVSFREAYVGAATEVAEPLIANGNSVGPLLLTMTLVDFDSTATRKTLIAGLESNIPAVRYWCARGLNNLADRIEGLGAGAVDPTINALQQAGARESNAVVLRAIYQALRYGSAAARCAQAAASILEGRVTAYQTGQPNMPSADLEALVVMARMANPSNNVVRLCGISLAKTLKLAAEIYARQLDTPEDERNVPLMRELEPFIQQGEARLRRLCQQAAVEPPTQNLSSAMKAEDSDLVRQAMGAWFGQGDEEGVMSSGPFNLPVGLGVELQAPASAGSDEG
jgi:hypothetical protein